MRLRVEEATLHHNARLTTTDSGQPPHPLLVSSIGRSHYAQNPQVDTHVETHGKALPRFTRRLRQLHFFLSCPKLECAGWVATVAT
jgi:hypothetical protein